MSTTVTVLIGLSLGTFALKSAGPLLLGGRPLPPVVETVSRRIPAALLAALVVVSTVADGAEIVVDARIAGIAVAGIALRVRAPFVLVVVAAVTSTAVLRAII